ncbi:MAG: orotidine-5'-phosphate decarboxylase [Clostridiales bacterium]|jgi:orotidine-5'-phosphate decarboxylase|nr:orotidine-5'-phosphate decarboxylase [Clostridiales bacterium]
MNAIDKLIKAIERKGNPTALGLDTDASYLPESVIERNWTRGEACKHILAYNVALIDRLKSIVPCVKVQAAYYEQYGAEGMITFSTTLAYASTVGLVTIADVKRNDIGSTAAAYAKAYLRPDAPFAADFITVNGYLGADGVQPFVDACKVHGKGIFVLVKTSNPGSAEFQDRVLDNGNKLYEEVAARLEQWGKPLVGTHGYSAAGAVVGATYPEQGAALRKAYPGLFFLVPGYGAPGGGAKDIVGCFDGAGSGAVVNNSRGLLCAYKQEKYKGMTAVAAAYAAAVEMREDIAKALVK